jgi:hypothetical protein
MDEDTTERQKDKRGPTLSVADIKTENPILESMATPQNPDEISKEALVGEDHWLLGGRLLRIGWVNSGFEGFEASNDRSGCGGFGLL